MRVDSKLQKIPLDTLSTGVPGIAGDPCGNPCISRTTTPYKVSLTLPDDSVTLYPLPLPPIGILLSRFPVAPKLQQRQASGDRLPPLLFSFTYSTAGRQ